MPRQPSPVSGYRIALVLAGGITAVSFAAIFVRWCQAPPMAIAFYRLLFAALLFWITGGTRYAADLKSLSRRDALLGLLSGLALALHFATWITSLSYTSIASSVVLVATSPIFVAIGAIFVLHEPVHPMLFAGLLLALAGALLITFAESGPGTNSLFGNGLAVAGAGCGGIYFLLGRILRKRLATIPYVTFCYSAAAFFLLLGTRVLDVPLRGYSPQTFGMFLLLALLPQVIGHTSFNWALKHLSAPAVSITLLGEPVGASLLAYLFFGEQLSLQTTIGGGLTLAGVTLAIIAEGRKS